MQRIGRLDLGKRLRRPALSALVPIILIGLVGTAVALSDRAADPQFVYRQSTLTAVEPAQLAHLMSLPRDPVPGLGRPRAIGAECVPQGIGEMRNPWMCVVRYARGGAVRYNVTITPTGNVVAINRSGPIIIHGCCIGSRPEQ